MKLSVFIDCLCDGNLDALRAVMPLSIDDEALRNLWVSIYREYCELVAPEEVRERNELVADIELLNTKILHTTALVKLVSESTELLNDGHISILAECLRDWGFEGQFSSETIVADLERVLRWLSSDRLRLELAMQQYNNGAEEDGGESERQQPKRVDFVDNLLVLEEHRKYSLKAEELTVMQYARMLRSFHEYCERMEMLTPKNR